jgi:DNA uptake protein ComE-like DNA-binding protein
LIRPAELVYIFREMRLRMKLLVLSVALTTLAIASCRSPETTTNSPAAISGSQIDKPSGAQPRPQQPCLNLNIATTADLIKLPGVGDVIAKRIIDYRERHGRLRRPEEIIIIEGFSERKYRAIAELVCVE